MSLPIAMAGSAILVRAKNSASAGSVSLRANAGLCMISPHRAGLHRPIARLSCFLRFDRRQAGVPVSRDLRVPLPRQGLPLLGVSSLTAGALVALALSPAPLPSDRQAVGVGARVRAYLVNLPHPNPSSRVIRRSLEGLATWGQRLTGTEQC